MQAGSSMSEPTKKYQATGFHPEGQSPPTEISINRMFRQLLSLIFTNTMTTVLNGLLSHHTEMLIFQFPLNQGRNGEQSLPSEQMPA